MGLVRIDNVGTVGYVTDLPEYSLPPNVWSDSLNVDFDHLVVKKQLGYLSSSIIGSPIVNPYFSFIGKDAVSFVDYFIYAGLKKVYTVIDGVHANITRTAAGADVDYSAGSNNAWTGGVLNGILVLNNGLDAPQKWTMASTTQRLANLDDWSTTWKAGVIRPFRNFLVALDVTKDAVRYPHMVKWSNSASIGNIPLSWNSLDATKDAGEFQLSETEDYCVDCLPLRNVNIIYKQDTTWVQQFIGLPFVFGFEKIFGNSGIAGRNCVVDLDSKHYVITKEDFITHDGGQIQSILTGKDRTNIFNGVNFDDIGNSFVTLSKFEKKIVFALPFNSIYPDTFFIYDVKYNTLSKKSVAPMNSMVIDFGLKAVPSWDAITNTWDNVSFLWRFTGGQSTKLISVSSTNNKLYSMFDGTQADGQEYTATVSRFGYSFINEDFKPEDDRLKLIRFVRPEISASSNVTVNVYLGSKLNYQDAIDWGNPVSFDTATDKEIYFLKLVRYFGVKFESTQGGVWELKSYSIDIQDAGNYL